MGVAAMLVMCKAFEQLFIPKDPGGVYEILFQSSQLFQSFRGEVVWNCGRTIL